MNKIEKTEKKKKNTWHAGPTCQTSFFNLQPKFTPETAGDSSHQFACFLPLINAPLCPISSPRAPLSFPQETLTQSAARPKDLTVGVRHCRRRVPLFPVSRDYLELSRVSPSLPLVIAHLLDVARQFILQQIEQTVRDPKITAVVLVTGEQKEEKGGALKLTAAPTISPWRPLPVGMTHSSRNPVEHRERPLPTRRRRGWGHRSNSGHRRRSFLVKPPRSVRSSIYGRD